MAARRDNFPSSVRKALAARVNYRCSNPECRLATTGPSHDPGKSVDVGVAAHITAAAAGGERYDPSLTKEERKSAENGIWLCQNHAKLVDNDSVRYTVEVLREWKDEAESAARAEIEGSAPALGAAGGRRTLKLLSEEVELLSDEVSEMVGEELERARLAFREGRSDEALEWLRKEKENEARWDALTPELRSRVLHFEAGTELEATGDVERARQLASEAREQAPGEDDARLQALITYRESGPDAAIELLDGHVDTESLNLRAALILETDRADRAQECRAVLDVDNDRVEPDANTFRLRSVSYLLEKDLDRARLEIQKAQERDPHWVGVRLTSASIGYFTCLSPAVLSEAFPPPWPEPVDWHLVRRDDESLARLRTTAKTFSELAEKTADPEKRQRLEAWTLACLANDAAAQGEAVEYAARILDEKPVHFQAILWTIARRFDVDLGPSETSLEELVDGGTAEYSHVLALASIFLASERPDAAVDLLGRTKGLFDNEGVGELWTFWSAQALALSGDPESSLKLIDGPGAGPKLPRARTVVLRSLAEKTGDWQQLARHLEDAYRKTQDPVFFADRCELAAHQQDWDYVADRAEELITKMETDEAVRLASVAAFNSQRYELCLRLLDDNRDLFAGRKLPEDLRRVRILCHSALGIFPRAVAEAEALVAETSATWDLLGLAQLYQAKGDLKSLALIARRLQADPNLSAEHFLRLSQSVRLEDNGLAASLWRKAIDGNLPDSLVNDAVFLGFQLGLDREVDSLYERMVDLASRGVGGWFGPAADFIPMLEEQRSNLAEVMRAYRHGKLPVHLVAERRNLPLSDFYHPLLSDNERRLAPLEQFALLVRYGGRASPPDFPDALAGRRLNLDVTAVLLAAHLEVLSAIEEAFGPLRVPADVIPAIVHMAEKTTHHQPSMFGEYGEIIELSEQRLLGTVDVPPNPERDAALVDDLGEDWVALFERAREDEGFLLDFLPPTKLGSIDQPAALPDGAEKRLVNHRAVLEALNLQGQLSEKEYSEALGRLGEQGRNEPSEAIPQAGAALYCSATSAELLSSAGLLRHACETFRVYVEERELEDARAVARYRERSSAQVGWLNGLRDRLRQGIDEGAYEIIPLLPGDDEPVRSDPSQLDLRCLETLSRFEATESDVIWADDRMVSSYPAKLNVPIIGIDDVLKALVGAGSMTPNDYYEKLVRLRAANARYFPVWKDEILHHLSRARTENGEVLETRPLRILRRYVAACLAQAEELQSPPMPEEAPNQAGEVEFVLSLNREITLTLLELWRTEGDEERRLACVEWLIAALYLDGAHLQSLTAATRSEDEEHFALALGLAGLVFMGLDLQLSGELHGGSEDRTSYLEWVQGRLLQKRFDADPRMVEGVAEALKGYLGGMYGEAETEGRELGVGLLLRLYCNVLPEPLREKLTGDADFIASLGGQQAKVVTLGGLAFHPGDFAQAAHEAINGRESKTVPLDGDGEVVFAPVEGDSGIRALRFTHPISGADVILTDRALMVLRDSPAEREATLRSNRQWFDCPAEEFQAAIAEIASTEDLERRLDKVESWRGSSAAAFYAALPRRVQGRFSFSELRPPSARGLIRYLRLESKATQDKSLKAALEDASRQLIREEGLLAAMERFLGLPISIPAPLVEAVAALSLHDRRLLLKRLLKLPGSPLSQIHMVRLLTRFGSDSEAYLRLVRLLVSGLVGEEGSIEFDAFCALLRWANTDFDNWAETRSWSSSLRIALVWSHAHRVHAAFAHARGAIDWTKVRDTFAGLARRLTTEIFERDADFYFDVAHPRHVERSTLLFMGLAYALGTSSSPRPLTHLISPSLLLDPTLASDGLGSFLGGDRGAKLTGLLEEDDANKLTRLALRGLTEAALEDLLKPTPDTAAWAQLYAVVDDHRPYEELRTRVAEVIRRTDFAALVDSETESGLFALRVACLQCRHVADEQLRLKIREDLLKAAKQLADTDGRANLARGQKEQVYLVESALHLAVAAEPSADVYSEFAEILTRLTDAWPATAELCKGIVQRLLEELPLVQGRHFRTLLLRLRSS